MNRGETDQMHRADSGTADGTACAHLETSGIPVEMLGCKRIQPDRMQLLTIWQVARSSLHLYVQQEWLYGKGNRGLTVYILGD